mgnify:CR=1 FL=1
MTKKRKQYLVKPKLQIKYLVILAFIIILCSIMIYYAFLDSLLTSPGMDQLSAGAVKNFVRSYTSGFFWMTLIFTIIVLIESIFYFHRLIGPVFFFEKVMDQLSDGNFSINVHHRKKDETIELAKSMNKTIKNIRSSVSEDRKKIELIKAAIDNGDKDNAKHMLCELTQWFKLEQ